MALKEQRGGGVHKNKYRNSDREGIFKPSRFSKDHIKDTWLKEHSPTVIKNCYRRDDPGPVTTIYPSSSWSTKSAHIMKLRRQFPVLI